MLQQPERPGAARACFFSKQFHSLLNRAGSFSTSREVGFDFLIKHTLSGAASQWIDSSWPYAHDPASKLYNQSTLAASLLSKLLQANEAQLSKLTASGPAKLPAGLAGGSPISDLIRIGIRDEAKAAEVLRLVFAQLGQQTEFVVPYDPKRRSADVGAFQSYWLSTRWNACSDKPNTVRQTTQSSSHTISRRPRLP